MLRRHVARVAIANPLQVRLIAEARVKTDKIDAAVLAQLYSSGFLPEAWMPDEDTLALRRQISRCSQLVRQRTRLMSEIDAVLAAHLIERCPASELFGRKGSAWLGAQPLPMDERLAPLHLRAGRFRLASRLSVPDSRWLRCPWSFTRSCYRLRMSR